MSRGKLSPRQARFVSEYLVDLNAKQAAIRAGYAPRGAEVRGCELLRLRKVADAVTAGRVKQSERTGVTENDVVDELKLLAFLDVGDVFDFSGNVLRLRTPCTISEAGRRAISSIKVKKLYEREGNDMVPVEIMEFKLHDKIAALREFALHIPGFRAPARVAPTDPTGTKPYEQSLTDEERAVRLSQILDRIRERKEQT